MKRPMKRHNGLVGLIHTHRVDEFPRGKGFTAETRVVKRGEESEGAFEGSFMIRGSFMIGTSENKKLG